MQRNKYLRGENPVATWMDITLTTHRVWQVSRQGSSAAMISFPLDAVQWVKLDRRHMPYLLWFALLVAVGGIVALEHDRTITYWLFGVVLLLMLLYGTSRRLVVSIGAGSEELVVQVPGEAASVESALDFLFLVETRRLAHAAPTPTPVPPERPAASSSSTWVSPPNLGG
jgi:hypothetical protein